MMRQLFTYLLLLMAWPLSAGIRLNEVMQANVDVVIDDLNNFPEGWVELYNDGESPINLKYYSLAKKKQQGYALPDTVLNPHEYLLVYCDKENVGLHTDFQLPLHKEGSLYLLQEEMIVDSVSLQPILTSNVSYSRLEDGAWHFVHQPTPIAPNDVVIVEDVLPSPLFSVGGGVKTSSFKLKLELPAGVPNDAKIVYTLNGDAPTDSSAVYKQPIEINGSTIVRAMVVSATLANSPVVTRSYLFLNRQQTLPVISLVGDSDYFFGDELGIYTRGTYGQTHPNSTPKVTVFGRANYYYDWGRPVNMEYFPLNADTSTINQWCEVKIGGNASRRLSVKSLVVKADKLYGSKNFNCVFFQDKPRQQSVKSVMLRNSGQDMAYTFLRDAFMQHSFARNTHIDYQAYQPVLLFINGQYYGLRNIRERSNDDYIKANYGLSDGYDLISSFNGRVEVGDSVEFLQFKKVYEDSLSTYNQLDSLMDVDEFLDYLIMNSLYCNTDFPGNNMLMWKPQTENSRWRWIAKDMDFGMGRSSSPYDLNYLNFILRKEPFLNRNNFNAETACRLFQKMMALPTFREAFVDRAAVYMGTFASPEKLCALLDSMAANIDYEIPFFSEFRGKNEEDWQSALTDAKNWLNQRIPYLYSDLSRFFELGKAVPLQIQSNGKCYFNNLPLKEGSFDGQYFEQRRICLSTDSLKTFKTDEFHQHVQTNAMAARFTEWVGDCWTLGIPQHNNGAYRWQVQYVKNDSIVTELYADGNLDWTIPVGATSVSVTQSDYEVNPKSILDNSRLTFEAFDFNGRLLAKGNYSQVSSKLKSGQIYILSTFGGNKRISTTKLRRIGY